MIDLQRGAVIKRPCIHKEEGYDKETPCRVKREAI